MKKNRLILIIAILLAVAALYFIYSNTKGTLSKSSSDFAVADTSLITKIFLTDKQNKKVLLERKAPGNWMVNEKYTASNDFIEIFLKTLMKLEVKAPVAKAARNNIIKRLAAMAVKTEVYQTVFRIDLWGLKLFPREKLVKTYYVGDATMNNMGTYMLMEDSEEPYILQIPGFRGFLNSRYSTNENDWRNHLLFSLEIPEIKSVKLEFPSSPDSSYLIENAGKTVFKLIAPHRNSTVNDYDTIKLLNCLASYKDVKFETLITDNSLHNKDSVLKTTPFHILTITDITGKTSVIKTYHKAAPYDQEEFDRIVSPYDIDRLFASFNEGKDFAMIQFYVFDNILKPLTYFLKPESGKK